MALVHNAWSPSHPALQPMQAGHRAWQQHTRVHPVSGEPHAGAQLVNAKLYHATSCTAEVWCSEHGQVSRGEATG